MNLSDSIVSIEDKIVRLMNLCEVYKRKIIELEASNIDLKEELKIQSNTLKNNEERQHLSQLVKNISLTNENKLDTKRKIADFVQEIEKCIEILNYNDSILK